jgi:ubiquinone/menaquinone biosynthesis C-methylase UbiE
MKLTPQAWHHRFIQQAQWTQELRQYLFHQVEMDHTCHVLEVGCGTGAILADIPTQAAISVGLDIDHTFLALATRNTPQTRITQGDAGFLPFRKACFDITFCHFLLLWVKDPLQILRELVRVTRPGGAVLAMAEPDYGGRIDHPKELAPLGKWQMAALTQQGADPLMGRKLAGYFAKLGLETVETGVLGGQWSGSPDWMAWESEWAVLESDLGKEFGSLKELDKRAYQQGGRVLFVPTFYAWGLVPEAFK